MQRNLTDGINLSVGIFMSAAGQARTSDPFSQDENKTSGHVKRVFLFLGRIMDLDALQRKYEARFKKKHKPCKVRKIAIIPRGDGRKGDNMNRKIRGLNKVLSKVGKMSGAL